MCVYVGVFACAYLDVFVCVCLYVGGGVAGDPVVEALDSWPCGCEFKSHQIQICFQTLQITPPPAYTVINGDLALDGDGKDH